jgi:hypothetical protein
MRRVAVVAGAAPVRQDKCALPARLQDSVEFIEEMDPFPLVVEVSQMLDEMRAMDLDYTIVHPGPTGCPDVKSYINTGKVEYIHTNPHAILALVKATANVKAGWFSCFQ